MSMEIQVFYMRPEWFREGIMGAKPNLATLDATHVLLLTTQVVRDPAKPVEDLLDEVYYRMQGENWSPKGEARSLIEEKGLEHTSMSVGDVAVVDGVAWLVAPVGFERLR